MFDHYLARTVVMRTCNRTTLCLHRRPWNDQHTIWLSKKRRLIQTSMFKFSPY